MATLTSLTWTDEIRVVPPAHTTGIWHVVGLKFRGSKLDAEFCLGWDDPDCPPTADYLCERFSDPRWYVCNCSRCRGQVVLVFAPDGWWAVQIRDRLSRADKAA